MAWRLAPPHAHGVTSGSHVISLRHVGDSHDGDVDDRDCEDGDRPPSGVSIKCVWQRWVKRSEPCRAHGGWHPSGTFCPSTSVPPSLSPEPVPIPSGSSYFRLEPPPTPKTLLATHCHQTAAKPHTWHPRLLIPFLPSSPPPPAPLCSHVAPSTHLSPTVPNLLLQKLPVPPSPMGVGVGWGLG